MNADRMAGDFAPADMFLAKEASRRWKRARPRRWPLAVLALLGCGMVAVAMRARSGGEDAASPSPASAFSVVGFVADERLAPMVAFRQAEAGRTKVVYEARKRQADGERWDTLTVGVDEADESWFRVTLRHARSAGAKPSLFVDLARQSAEIGAAVVHATNAQVYAAERGPIEWAEVTLSSARGERPCLGFRLVGADAVDLSGLACGGRDEPLDRTALVRLIGRLVATNAGAQAGLGDVLRSGSS